MSEGIKIRAIVKRPDEEFGHVTNISDTLKNLQNTVDGPIEVIPIPGTSDVILVNENGKLTGLPLNMYMPNDFLVGTIAVVGTSGEEFADCDLQFRDWKKMVQDWEAQFARIYF